MTDRQEPALAMRLDGKDSVAVVLVRVQKGDHVRITGRGDPATIAACEDIPCYHKIALADVRAGDILLRAASAIGRATEAIAVGDWVHTHNLASLSTQQTADDPNQ